MNHFDYRNGVLHAEAVNLSDIADAVGTPFYCYSTATLERHYRVFTEAFAGENVLVCYAMKANSNQSVLRTLAKLGAGADVVTGADVHIGSQITDLSRMEAAFRILSEFVQTLRADGHTISHVDFGGGLGIPYYRDREAPPAPDAYAAMVKRVAHNLGCTLMFEPGRMIVGNAGILVTRVIYVKPGDAKNFVIIDAAMNDLIRPTLYEAHHDILPVRETPKGAPTIIADVVGPVCETGDYLALDRSLPEPKAGDLLAVMTAGAYGAVQASTYNTRALVPEVLVKDDQYAVVRPRIDVDALIAMDKPAPWM